MHLHFIFPRWPKLLEAHPELSASLSAHEVGSLRMTSLGIPTAAGALPEDVQVTMLDDHLEDACSVLPAGVDAVCIGFFTPQATRAYEIADHWRAQGIPVLFGGIHPSAIPEDAAPHADAILSGPAEGVWQQVLPDLAAQQLRPLYQGDYLAPFAVPRRDLFRHHSHLRLDVLQTARGCDRRCAFCVVPKVNGQCIIRKPVHQALDECASTQHLAVFLGDENILHPDPQDILWAEDFCAGLAERRLRRFFTAAAYPKVLIDFDSPRARQWHAAGLRQIYLICGYMGPLSQELANPALLAAMQRLQDIGIEVLATFTLGHDADPVAVDDLVLDFWQRSGANLAEVTIAVPFPGTQRFSRYQAEGRLLHYDWQRYNGAWCVFQPHQGSADAVEACSLRLWQALYAERNRYQVQQSYLKGFGREVLRSTDIPEQAGGQ